MSLSVTIHKELPGFTLDVDFETNGQTLGLLGASGSGKSMTLRCIAGLENPDSGRIILNGRTLYDSFRSINLPSRVRNVGMLFQNYALFPHLTVVDNIGFGLDGMKRTERRRTIDEMISMTRLTGLESRYPWELSGGQQQRVALARSLAVNPECLLLDEPFSALDDYLRNLMIREFSESVNSYRGSMLFVTHNIDEAFKVCGSLLVLSDGKMCGSGETHELFQNPPTLDAARITGCKNITHAEKVSEHEVFAPAWGVNLFCRKTVPATTAYAAIRANHLEMDSRGKDLNIIPCSVSGFSEAPFRIIVFLVPANISSHDESSVLQWDISKDFWMKIKDIPQPWRMYVDPERMFVTA
jgi:ABC-type sulfate/molybdate transport systems ATPase subunit